jgi:unsaturated chondroitin disaccharide hydrolase
MLHIRPEITTASLSEKLTRLWELAGKKIRSLQETSDHDGATPVFTAGGRYQPQGWTEWTQGFQFGCQILQFDATGEDAFLEMGRRNTLQRMAPHLTHFGVHDHGFNNVSTYGNLRRLMLENRIPHDERELQLYELALQVSGAVQAMRWSETSEGDGYIYSFNGPHSLFCDTIRSLRSLALAHRLGHRVLDENDETISLLGRLLEHARTTARYNVYYGEGRDIYDVAGRVAHEAIFNVNDGHFRCPSTQQGYSPFTTWTRGLAWILTGYAEQLEFLATCSNAELVECGGRKENEQLMRRAAMATADFYIDNTPTDGIPYWDSGAAGLVHLGDYLDRPAEVDNPHEPVDASAAAIAAQGFLRLGHYLQGDDQKQADRYTAAGLTILHRLLEEPYLSTSENHQGLLLHALYHRPRGWDHTAEGKAVPQGESCLWGDYHLMEAGLLTGRLASGETYPVFFGP